MVNPDNTQTIIFTNKKCREGLKIPMINPVKLVETEKYLGVK